MKIRESTRRELDAKYPSLARPVKRPTPPAPTDPTAITVGITPRRLPVAIPLRVRQEHMLMVGATGSGKSKLLLHFMRQMVRRGEGLLFLDPHGNHSDSVYRSLLAWMDKPAHVIDLNAPSVVGFNPLACPDDTDPSVIVGNVMAALSVGWEGESFAQKPTIERNLSAILTALVELGLTFCEMDFLLDREDAHGLRRYAIGHVKDTYTRGVLNMMDELARDGRRKRDYDQEVIGSVNRIARLIRPPTIRTMIGQTNGCIDIRGIMDAGGIILANLSGGTQAFDTDADLLGRLLTRTVLFHAKRRGNAIPFNVVLDEAHRFLSADIPVLLAEIRKYGVSITAAIQWLEQAEDCDEAILAALLNGTNCKVCFRLRDAEEAEQLARSTVSIDLERPVDVLIKPTVVGHRRIELKNQNDSEQQSETKSEAETHGKSMTKGKTVTESETYGRTVSENESSSRSVTDQQSSSDGASESTSHGTSEVFIPTLDPNEPFLSRMVQSSGTAKGASAVTTAGTGLTTGTTKGTTIADSETYGMSVAISKSFSESYAKTKGRAETRGTGHSRGFSEALEPILERLPSAVHSIQNELYLAGLMLRSLPTAIGYVSYVGREGPVSTLFQVPPVFGRAIESAELSSIRDRFMLSSGAVPKDLALKAITDREHAIKALSSGQTKQPQKRPQTKPKSESSDESVWYDKY